MENRKCKRKIMSSVVYTFIYSEIFASKISIQVEKQQHALTYFHSMVIKKDEQKKQARKNLNSDCQHRNKHVYVMCEAGAYTGS